MERGTYYELALEIARSPDDDRLSAAIDRLWEADEIAGVKPKLAAHGEITRSEALLSVDELGELGCVIWQIRESGASDWLTVSIPSAALEPFADPVEALESTLVALAAHLFLATPFVLGVIGEEVSGLWSAEWLTAHDAARGGFLLPDALAEKLRVKGAETVPGLRWIARP